MKKIVLVLLCLCCCLVFISGKAIAYNQNPNLNMGLTLSLDAVLPPPGLYLTLYNVYYTADTFTDRNGKSLPGDNRLDALGIAPQLTFVSPDKIFGLSYGFQVLTTIFGLDVDSDLGLESGRSGFGDLIFGPFVGSSFKPTDNSTFFLILNWTRFFQQDDMIKDRL